MSVYFLLVTCLVGFVLATTFNVPSYLKICGRRNPYYDECVTTSIMSLRPKLKEGIREWNISSIDPYEAGDISLADTPDFMATAKRAKLFELSDYFISKLHFDMEKLLLTCDVHFDVVRLSSDYTLRAKLGSAVVAGTGPMTFVAKGVHADLKIQMQLTKYHSEPYLSIRSITTKLAIDDYNATIASSKETDPAITDSMNIILNNHKDIFSEQIIPRIEQFVSEVTLKFGNTFCSNLPARIIFPDSE